MPKHKHNYCFTKLDLSQDASEALTYWHCRCGDVIRKRTKVREI